MTEGAGKSNRMEEAMDGSRQMGDRRAKENDERLQTMKMKTEVRGDEAKEDRCQAQAIHR